MSTVDLYLYDLSGGMASMMGPPLGVNVDGIWHTAIVAYGNEYYFDGGVGIERGSPGRTRFGTPTRKMTLGRTTKTRSEFEAWNASQRDTFGPNDYHLLNRNCNHYSDAAGKYLCGVGTPPEVRDQVTTLLSSPIGQAFRPMIESMMGPSSAAQPPARTGYSGTGRAPGEAPQGPAVPPEMRQLLSDLVDDVESYDKSIQALSTIITMLRNLRDHPNEDKYRRVRLENKMIAEKVASYPPAVDLLALLGFRKDSGMLVYGVTPDTARLGEQVSVLTSALSEIEEMKQSVELSLAEESSQQTSGAPRTSVRWGAPGSQPGDPLLAGKEQNGSELVVGRGMHMGRVYVGKCGRHLGSGNINVALNGVEAAIHCQQLLFGEGSWQQHNATMPLPRDAVPAGKDGSGATQYVARMAHEGGVHPGVVNGVSRECIITYGGQKVVSSSYEILVSDEVLGADDLDPERPCQPTCTPLLSIDELLTCDFEQMFPVECCGSVPLAPKKMATENTKGKVIVCHDYKGGYVDGDRCPQAAFGSDDHYRLREWALVDKFIYFSHHRITIPPAGWINAAHRHGVPCMGTIIVEHSMPKDMRLVGDRLEEVVGRLVELAVHCNFDGWLVNFEVPMDPNLVCSFLALLTSSMHECNPSSTVLMYDSLVVTGELKYQNCLSPANLAFFESCDGLFTNYWWNPQLLDSSVSLAGPRKRDVYFGVDIFGRGTYGGGGMDTEKAVKEIIPRGLSCALFAPGWTFETSTPSSQCSKDDAFWKSILEHYNTVHPAIGTLPFCTTFNTGCGRGMRSKGTVVRAEPWMHLSQSTVLPRLPLLPVEPPKNCTITTALTPETAYDGGHGLMIRGELSTAGFASMELFRVGALSLPTQSPVVVELISRGGPEAVMLCIGDAARDVLHTHRDACRIPAQAYAREGVDVKHRLATEITPLTNGFVRHQWVIDHARLCGGLTLVALNIGTGMPTSQPRGVEIAIGQFALYQQGSSPQLEGLRFERNRLRWICLSGRDDHFGHADIFCNDRWLGRAYTCAYKIESCADVRPGCVLRVVGTSASGRAMNELQLTI